MSTTAMEVKPENCRVWDRLSKTDPKHTKKFTRGGGFSGTAIKPIWTIRQMTEVFGPCGIGWGMEKPEFVTQEAATELLVFCTVCLWYTLDGSRGVVYGVGGDKYLVDQKSGRRASDEAYKAAYTDAIGNAMKMLGVSADVHMGLFDDNKYVREMEKEFSEPETPKVDTISQVRYVTAEQAKKFRDAVQRKGITEEAKKALAGIKAPTSAQIPADEYEGMMRWVDEFEGAA